MKPAHPFYVLGRFIWWKYRTLATVRGIPYASKRMVRDGIPKPFHGLIFMSEGYEPPPKAEPPKTAPRASWRAQLASYFRRKTTTCDTSPP